MFGGVIGYGADFMNKANRPYIPVSPNEAVQPVVALYNYVARTAEELSFNVGECYFFACCILLYSAQTNCSSDCC